MVLSCRNALSLTRVTSTHTSSQLQITIRICQMHDGRSAYELVVRPVSAPGDIHLPVRSEILSVQHQSEIQD